MHGRWSESARGFNALCPTLVWCGSTIKRSLSLAPNIAAKFKCVVYAFMSLMHYIYIYMYIRKPPGGAWSSKIYKCVCVPVEHLMRTILWVWQCDWVCVVHMICPHKHHIYYDMFERVCMTHCLYWEAAGVCVSVCFPLACATLCGLSLSSRGVFDFMSFIRRVWVIW